MQNNPNRCWGRNISLVIFPTTITTRGADGKPHTRMMGPYFPLFARESAIDAWDGERRSRATSRVNRKSLLYGNLRKTRRWSFINTTCNATDLEEDDKERGNPDWIPVATSSSCAQVNLRLGEHLLHFLLRYFHMRQVAVNERNANCHLTHSRAIKGGNCSFITGSQEAKMDWRESSAVAGILIKPPFLELWVLNIDTAFETEILGKSI